MKTLGEELEKFKSKKDISRDLLNSYSEALTNPFFKELVSNINKNSDELMKYTSLLEESACEYEKCSTCKNLLECKNKITGHIFTPVIIDNNLEFTYSPCKFQQKYNKEYKYLNNVTFFEVSNELKNANMKDIFTDDASRLEAIEWLMNFLKKYPKVEKGLYLHGSFGTGKTYLIAALFNELAKKGIKSSIIYWPEFLRDLKASFNTDFKERFEYIKKAPLLLIDDIGAENTTDWGRDEVLGPLLQHRMQMNLITFFTSNFDIELLEGHFSVSKDKISVVKAKRIIERISYITETRKIIGKNRRK